jgi:hypothetical protein
MSLLTDLLAQGFATLRTIGGTPATWERKGATAIACTVTFAPTSEDLMGDGGGISAQRKSLVTVGTDQVAHPAVDDVIRIESGHDAGLWTVTAINESTAAATVTTARWAAVKKIGDPAALRRSTP